MQVPVGTRVLYKLHEGDAEQVNRRREDFYAFTRANPGYTASPGDPGRSGHVGHFGNEVTAGEVYPADVVRVFSPGSSTVNLQVHLDGNDTYWATSRPYGDGPGQWSHLPGA